MSQGRAQYTMQFDHYAASAAGGRRGSPRNGSRAERRREAEQTEMAKAKFQRNEAALQRRHDRSRRSWQDDVDGGDHQGSGGDGRGEVHAVRPDRQGAGGEGARDHDHDGARRVRDREPALRPCRLPGPRRLREEHDHRCGADGRRDPGGVGGRRADAADPRAHPAGAPGRRAGDGGVPEQGRHGRRPGAAGAGRARGARAAVAPTSFPATTSRSSRARRWRRWKAATRRSARSRSWS